MPSRLVKPRRLPTPKTPEFSIHLDYSLDSSLSSGFEPTSTSTYTAGARHDNGAHPGRTLAPASFGVVNSMKSYGAQPNGAAPAPAAHQYSNSFSHSTSSGKLSPGSPYFVSSPSLVATRPGSGTPRMLPNTIRTIPSFDGILSDTSSEAPSIATKNSALSSSVASNASATSMGSRSENMDDTIRPGAGFGGGGGLAGRGGSSSGGGGGGFARRESYGEPLLTPQLASPTTAQAGGPSSAGGPSNCGADDAASLQQQQQPWDPTIGKAGLGKTGRVINKLVSENEALKRDLKIERLRAEEARQTAKLMQDKMERAEEEYESRLLDASVTKTLLARKERQVETLTVTVGQERERARAALEREQTWKAEMERSSRDNGERVQAAETQAALLEGRYNTIASHWKEQGETLKREAAKLRTEIGTVAEERRRDDEKIQTLRDVCDQQDGNVRDLEEKNRLLLAQHEAYKQQQDDMLRNIKEQTRLREEEQEALMKETKETLDKLKWALNVHKNVPGAK